MERRHKLIYLNQDNALQSHTGHVFKPEITRKGLLAHYASLNRDLRYIADEFYKVWPEYGVCLSILQKSLEEGSSEELIPFLDQFLSMRSQRIAEGTWPFPETKKTNKPSDDR